MVKHDLIRYKYEVQADSSFVFNGFTALVLIAGIAIISTLLVTAGFIAGIVAIVVFVIVIKFFAKSNKAITLHNQFMIMGDRVLYFKNIAEIQVRGENNVIELIPRNGESVKIQQRFFPTNARKDWKIAKNKRAKFIKVGDKLLNRVKKRSPGTRILVDSCAELNKYKS